MRKHNDGYVLPFVLVVLVVVCLVAVSLMSSALSNLQRQQASIQRMEAKYAAQGEIERAVTNWDTKVNQTYTGNFPEGTAEDEKTGEYAAQLVLKEIFGTDVTVEFSGEPEKFEYKKTDSLAEGMVAAEVVVSVTVKAGGVTLKTAPEEAGLPDYSVTVAGTVTYESYTVSHEEVTPE